MNGLSPLTSRLVAIGILFILLLPAWLYLVQPICSYYSDRTAEVTLKRRQLAQYQYLLSNKTLIEDSFLQTESPDSEQDLFLRGSKPAIASANLREFVSEAVLNSGGELISSQEYEAKGIDSTTAIGLQLQVNCEIQDLIELLYAIETARPVVFVDELDVSSSNSRVVSVRPKRHERSTSNEGSLDVRLKAVGYLAGTEEEDADGSQK